MTKDLVIQMSDKVPGCYEVKYVGGGELPTDLEGAWTHQDKAQMAIDEYLIKRDSKRGTTSGSTRNKPRAD